MSEFRFQGNADQVIGQVRRGMRRNLTAAILAWQGSLVRVMAGPRTGAFYRKPGSRVIYQASAPGEAPAVRTGDTRASYQTEVRGESEAILGSTLIHALWLERGTTKMAPRPALQPAFDRARPEIVAQLGRPIDE